MFSLGFLNALLRMLSILFQCSECVDNFLGKPTNGHQCYRLMNVDRDYCLDPNTQMNCHSTPATLRLGRTIFFVVQPKYLNVDIRITLDITVGGMSFVSVKLSDSPIQIGKISNKFDLILYVGTMYCC